MTTRRLAFAALSLALLFAATADAQSWTRFRGPNGAGQSDAKDIPVPWEKKDYNWRAALPGVGDASPVVWGDLVYVTSADADDGKQFITCLRASDGKPQWSKSIESSGYHQHTMSTFAAATPAVDKDRLYVSWAGGDEYILAAFDRKSGDEIWRRDFGPVVTEHGVGRSPIVFEDLVIFTKEQGEWEDDPSKKKSFTVALDSASGETRWQLERTTGRSSYSTPCIYRGPDGKDQLIDASWAMGVLGIDPQTGKINWKMNPYEKRVVASPVIVGDLMFTSAGSGGGGSQMFAIKLGSADGSRKPEIAYEVEENLPYVPTPVAHGKRLFALADKGVITCLDIPTGKRIWRQRIGGNFFASPICVDGKIFCTSRNGEVIVLAAGDEYKELARVDLGEATNATPAVADGVMYLRTRSAVLSLGKKDAD